MNGEFGASDSFTLIQTGASPTPTPSVTPSITPSPTPDETPPATATPTNTPTATITPTPSNLAWTRSPSTLAFDEGVSDFQDVTVTASNPNATWSASLSGDSTNQLSIYSGATGIGSGTITIRHFGGSGIDLSVTLTITLTGDWTGIAPDLTVPITVGGA